MDKVPLHLLGHAGLPLPSAEPATNVSVSSRARPTRIRRAERGKFRWFSFSLTTRAPRGVVAGGILKTQRSRPCGWRIVCAVRNCIRDDRSTANRLRVQSFLTSAPLSASLVAANRPNLNSLTHTHTLTPAPPHTHTHIHTRVHSAANERF